MATVQGLAPSDSLDEAVNVEDLDNPDWVPDETLVCPVCDTAYPYEWNEEDECWWPGYAEWWFSQKLGIRFICSRRCYLATLERKTT